VASANIERFRAGFEALSRGDMDAVFANFAPEFEVRDHVIPESTEGAVGPKALSANLERFAEAFERFDVEPLEYEEIEDGMLVRIRARGRTERDGGMDLELEAGQLWRIREDGLAVSVDIYPSWEEARREAGLKDAP
jgi:ketosteroid isomerase-like protein